MISVIIPVYGVEKYLPKCIESLLQQTYKNIEFILVDDGSPDSCGKICDFYAEKNEQIVVIHQENHGVSAARNAGLKIAKGDYIGFVDPDDWIASDMYQMMYLGLQKSRADIAICGYDYYDEQGYLDESRRYVVRENEVVTQKEVMYRFSDMPPTIRHGVWNKLFKRDLLHNQKFKEGLHSSEDVLFLTEYVRKIKSAIIIHQPYYKNLVRQGSATHGGLKIESLADSFTAHYQMYTDAVNLYPELRNHSLAFLLDVCALKYKEAKKRKENLKDEEKRLIELYLKEMKHFIKKQAIKGILNPEIYWKTRIWYLIFK